MFFVACGLLGQLPKIVQNYQLLTDALLAEQTASIGPSLDTSPVEVATPDGRLRVERVSASSTSGRRAWLRARGVQYAEHPVGVLRWQPPVPFRRPGAIVDATRFGPECINAPLVSRLASVGLATTSESCLYLNVFAPDPVSVLLPVVVWVHGGSFNFGGTSGYNGDWIQAERRDVVIVTVNYRLGALGWLGGAAVSSNTTDGSAGNFGLQDTREALRWVQRNIKAFGGDPTQVTLAGESAGASIVATHLAAPRSSGLFARAVMQSGSFDNYTVQDDPDASYAVFAKAAGCYHRSSTANASTASESTLACLRALPLRTLTHNDLVGALAQTNLDGWFSPAIDGVELFETPEVSAASGRLNRVSAVLLGSNLDEGRFLVPNAMPVPNAPHSTTADLRQWVGDNFPTANSSRLLQLYASDVQANGPWGAAANMYTDSQYLCPTSRSARWLASAGMSNVFTYRLEFAPSFFEHKGFLIHWMAGWCDDFSRCPDNTAEPVGVGHSADIYLLFGDPRLSDVDARMARKVLAYWVNFAATGDPNSEHPPSGEERWPSYSAGGNATMRLAPASIPGTALRAAKCSEWDALHPVPY